MKWMKRHSLEPRTSLRRTRTRTGEWDSSVSPSLLSCLVCASAFRSSSRSSPLICSSFACGKLACGRGGRVRIGPASCLLDEKHNEKDKSSTHRETFHRSPRRRGIHRGHQHQHWPRSGKRMRLGTSLHFLSPPSVSLSFSFWYCALCGRSGRNKHKRSPCTLYMEPDTRQR